MKLALILNGVVRSEATEADAELVGHDGAPLFDIRDVSAAVGIAPGWLANKDGTFSAPPAPPVVVPQSVSSAQAKIQLLRTPGAESGKTLLDDVTAAVQVAGGEAKIWFDEARTWDRSSPYVASLSGGLNLTSGQVDTLFIEAAKILA